LANCVDVIPLFNEKVLALFPQVGVFSLLNEKMCHSYFPLPFSVIPFSGIPPIPVFSLITFRFNTKMFSKLHEFWRNNGFLNKKESF